MDTDAPRTQIYMRPRDALRRLADAGLVHGLDDAALDALRKECWDDDEDQLEEAGVVVILTMYYENIDKGRADGVYWRDDQFWNQTEDVIAELSSVLGLDPPLFTQEGVTEKMSTARRKEVVRVVSITRD